MPHCVPISKTKSLSSSSLLNFSQLTSTDVTLKFYVLLDAAVEPIVYGHLTVLLSLAGSSAKRLFKH